MLSEVIASFEKVQDLDSLNKAQVLQVTGRVEYYGVLMFSGPQSLLQPFASERTSHIMYATDGLTCSDITQLHLNKKLN